jgi:TPR repeat protein
MYFKSGLILSLPILPFGDLSAAEFGDAMDALSNGESREAYRGFKRLVKRDHVKIQYQLGMLCLFGMGADQGTGWLEGAANNGAYLAANELGQAYLLGKGVEINEKAAVKWLELATQIARQNEGEAEDGCE